MSVSRRGLLAVVSVAAIVTLAGCSDGGEIDTEPAAQQDAESAGVELDLDSLEAELPLATLQAEPWEDAWVGAVTEELFIGIRLPDGDGSEPRDVVAYLCDGELSVVLDGALSSGRATLTADDAAIDLELLDDEITGRVTLEGEDPVPFTAERATGSAGVYVAEQEVDDVEMTARWVALADGRQRGVAICCEWPPSGTGPPICRHCQQQN